MTAKLGGEVVAAMLAAEGVDTVFGIVDGTYLGLFASFEKYGIRFYSPRHETCALHMAGAYARITGKLGVCIASNGPGVANALPGVAVENGEGNRVLLLTSCRRQGIAYPDRGGTYQYFDQAGVTRAMAKWSGAVPSFDRIPELMRRAFRIAHRGRPGVVHVDLPENVLNNVFEAPDDLIRAPHQYRRTEPIRAAADDVEKVAAWLRDAERPLLHAGSGVVHALAYDELLEVAELLHAPVSTSWGARAVMPDAHKLALPVPLMSVVNETRAASDWVLVVGSRLGETDWWGKAPYWGRGAAQKLVQVDNDEEILGLNKPTELTILADAKSFLADLACALRAERVPADRMRHCEERIAALADAKAKARAEFDLALENRESPIHPAQVPHVCDQVFDEDAIVVVDGGNTAVWTTFFHEVKRPGGVLSTFKFGMLGAGVSQALGAKVAAPEKQVYCVIGDGAMGFHAQELETAVRHRLPVTYIVLCDRQWGMVKLTQTMMLPVMREALGVEGEGVINADFQEIAFDKLAESMGAHGERVGSPDELRAALERCVGQGGPSVVHVDVDPMQHLFAPGLQEFKAMHQEPAG
jgi:acetolactate synthase-1/2/3 large subunit